MKRFQEAVPSCRILIRKKKKKKMKKERKRDCQVEEVLMTQIPAEEGDTFLTVSQL